MQLLTFTVAGQTYAIESRRVVEVLPLIAARPIPHTPDYVRGIFTYRGHLVPLVDLGLRLAAAQLAQRLSTRVIVVDAALAGGGTQMLGLVAENVTAICSAEDAEASLPPLDFHDAPFLGKILRIGGRTIQLIAVEHLLPAAVTTGLYPVPTTASDP
jgi:chemotaxis-related protein WspB